MKKVIRLSERDLANLVRRVVKENQMCSPNDSKPSSDRPLCSEEGIKEGNLLVMGDEAYVQYTDEANCPKLCRVPNETKITFA
jgi:hypothetical protein